MSEIRNKCPKCEAEVLAKTNGDVNTYITFKCGTSQLNDEEPRYTKDCRLTALERKLEEANSALRDQKETYYFGAQVMNKIVLPNCKHMNDGEMAFDFLARAFDAFLSTLGEKGGRDETVE